jgi:hypothetical protein
MRLTTGKPVDQGFGSGPVLLFPCTPQVEA